jgi:superoxide dismutase, Fe-Mn family
MLYVLPKLSYSYDALEPYIDTRTMEIHYTKHHQAYIDNLNKALASYPALQAEPLTKLLTNIEEVPTAIRTAVRNHGGGHANHTLFWSIMKPRAGGDPKGLVAQEIAKTWTTVQNFQEQFNTAAKGVFGSGWAWLVVDATGKLAIVPLPNQDSPMMQGMQPIMGLDVWEHAYYLQYQNRRPDYIAAWWSVINWDQVEENYRAITQ